MKETATTQTDWNIFSLVAISVFMSTLDTSIVNIALPVIMKDLKAPLTTIEWIPMIYLLTVSSLLLPFGRLSEIKGRSQTYVSVAWPLALMGIGTGIFISPNNSTLMNAIPQTHRGVA